MIMSQTIRSRTVGLVLLIVLAMLGLGGVVVQQARASVLIQQPGDQPPDRERQSNLEAPTISFIENPTAQCYLPVAGTDACFINWEYLYVYTSAPAYMISMTVAIDGQIRANHQGFFQTSIYVPSQMLSPGFRVTCGAPGAGVNPWLGNSYAYTLRARDTDNLKAANYGTVTCPGDIVPVKAGGLTGPAFGSTSVAYNFTAYASPITATIPISYAWQVTDKTAITVTNGLTDTRSYIWSTPGVKNLVVDAYNLAGGINSTHTITILTPVTGLAASNDSPTTLGSPTQFNASITSGDSATFTWDFGDGQAGSGGAPSHTYLAAGEYTVTVQAENAVSMQTKTTTVTILEPRYYLYLPALKRQ